MSSKKITKKRGPKARDELTSSQDGSPKKSKSQGQPPTFLAAEFMDECASGDIEKVKEMLGQDERLVNSFNSTRKTPLHRAVEKQQVEIVRLLLQNGANVNVSDNGGWTPLHYACNFAHKGNVDLVSLLLDNGANLHAPDYSQQKQTPYTRALLLPDTPVAKFLVEYVNKKKGTQSESSASPTTSPKKDAAETKENHDDSAAAAPATDGDATESNPRGDGKDAEEESDDDSESEKESKPLDEWRANLKIGDLVEVHQIPDPFDTDPQPSEWVLTKITDISDSTTGEEGAYLMLKQAASDGTQLQSGYSFSMHRNSDTIRKPPQP